MDAIDIIRNAVVDWQKILTANRMRSKFSRLMKDDIVVNKEKIANLGHRYGIDAKVFAR